MPRFAEAMKRLGTETAFEVLARAKELEAQGRDMVHLEIGEPDFDTPANIIEAAKQALDQGYTHYGPSAGLPEFRQVIADYISKDRGVKVGPQHVVVTPGAKPIMFFAMMATLDPGDEAMYPNPGFPIYESVINYMGAKPVPLALRQENEFRLDLNEVKDKLSAKTKFLILNFPQNPTGGMLTKQDIKDLAAILRDYPDVWILTDEVYSKLIYEGEHVSIMPEEGMIERTILLEGFSKTYAMTGWRLGYGVMPEELAGKISRLATNCHSCTAAFTQRAGMAALTGPQDDTAKMRNEFKRRRDLIVKGLNEIDGIQCLSPRGAFYVFPRVADLGLKSKEIEQRLLNDYGVAALCGTAFGAFGEGHVRFSCANSMENLQKALDRVSTFVSDLKKG
jgi:aspartate aminotransferase